MKHIQNQHLPKQTQAQILEALNKFSPHQSSLKEGMPAPVFEFTNSSGELVNSESFQKKTVLLYFYPKSGTGTCNIQACAMRDEYSALQQKNIEVIGVSADSAAMQQKFANKLQLPFLLLPDTEQKIIKAYDVWGKKMLAGRIYDGIVRTSFLIESGIIKAIIRKVNAKEAGKQILELL